MVAPGMKIEMCIRDRAGIIQQRAKRTLAELVAVLGMDGFKGRELKAKLRGRDIYTLIARTLQVHLDARLDTIPARPMPEAAGIEVGAEFSIEAMQNVQIERRGDAIFVVIRPHESRFVFHHIGT